MSGIVKVGVFWMVPLGDGQGLLEFGKNFDLSEADENGFINYPYSHYEMWDEVRGYGRDCYRYPRGRVMFDVNNDRYRIFADPCVENSIIDELVELYGIADYELCRDEHYVCRGCVKKSEKAQKAQKILEYRILRGADKIGANLIEITYGKTRLLVELGKELDSGDELTEQERQVIATNYDAVIVSHYHADHAGLIDYKQDCPIYMGCGAYRIVCAMREYEGKTVAGNVATYRNGRSFTVGGVKITPFLCDHSAFDSYMLLFEAGGKSVLYTGDFRFHGRKPSDELLSRLPRDVDTLIYEGTNIGNTKSTMSESELEDRLVEVMRRNDKPVFVLQSGSNIDRLVSVYRAAKRSGRILYEDNYTALIATAAGGKIPRPDAFGDVCAFTPRMLRGRRGDMFSEFVNKRGAPRIAHGKKFAMTVRPSMLEYVKKLGGLADISGATLVYSMWSGYKDKPDTAGFLDGVKRMSVNIVDLHASGHATERDIARLRAVVRAKEEVCVHTDPNKKT